MPFITREDGEHFVVPSQRDVITVKSNSQLKRELELRSANYGEYITLQKKNATQYEAAFSPDPGYLLGESIWHHFNRPIDMIYCEEIPNTSEVILVIVKGGSVYLDGSFPNDSVVEELIVFLTQQNNFEIYTYGDVPISEQPEPGKLSFDSSAVKSFTILEQPVFPTLPLLKIYQLQLLSIVLAEHGIGVFPLRKVIIGLAFLGLGYFAYTTFFETEVQQAPVAPKQAEQVVDPFQFYYDTMASPPPDEEVKQFMDMYKLFLTIPGWMPQEVIYTNKVGTAKVTTKGADVSDLMRWADINNMKVQFEPSGITVDKNIFLPNRPKTTDFVDITTTLANLIDRIHAVYPGNVINFAQNVSNGRTKTTVATIELTNISPMVITMIGDQLAGLPVKILKISVKVSNNLTSSTIILQVVGS